ncbi:MAG: glycosyltransferase family 4 protein [Woeseiaceae bacterium]
MRPLFSDAYLRAFYDGESRILDVLSGYWRRIGILMVAWRYDLVWIEKEVLPFFPAIAELLFCKTKLPFVVDYDDALFHRYDGHKSRLVRSLLGRKIDKVMRSAALVIAGNDYLADRARAAGSQHVEVVPTVVDVARYRVAEGTEKAQLVIGWVGSPSTSHYLLALTPALSALAKEHDFRLVVVGASNDALGVLPVEAWDWSEETEVEAIQAFDIGIMPLEDSPWERGKCGYKLIQYMACGLPVVASPVGVNAEIVDDGANGFLAGSQSEWQESLGRLLDDGDLRRRMGSRGRERVEATYSLQAQAPRMEKMMRDVLRQPRKGQEISSDLR